MWYDDLCEYYDVTPEQAIELSERKRGRKPSLPGSLTCKPVSGKTWEELWHEKPRDTLEQKIEFYKDIGAWQSFRQCNYRKDFPYHYFYNQFCKPGDSILEYGCGIAPMANFFAEHDAEGHSLKFTLVEVPSEHFEFAKWRLQKKSPNTSFDFIEITHKNIIPKFEKKFDFICIMDVLEHLPNPHDVMRNITEHCSDGAILVETWVHHKHGPGESDLQEAEEEREVTQKFISENFNLIKDHGFMRVHRKAYGYKPSNIEDDDHLKEWLDED